LSSGSQEKHTEILGELARELRQFTGLGTSFFRAAAARIGITVTDMQVIDILESTGPMTAGQIADLTGLTTGAITGMLNRLEEAGLVRRERDPTDGRKVIVRLERGRDEGPKVSSTFASLVQAWKEMASHYDDKQAAFLLEYLKRSNALSRQEIVRLREAPAGEEGIFSAPLGELSSGRLVVSSGIARLTVHVDDSMTELYRARFERTGAGSFGQRCGSHHPLSTTSVGAGRGEGCSGGHAQRRHPMADRDPGRSRGDCSRTGWSRSRRAGGQRGGSARSVWSFPRPLAWFPYGSAGVHQISPFYALQVSPPESTSEAGPPHLSSTTNLSVIWATMCGCKALALIPLPHTTTSKSQAPPAWSPSPPVDARKGVRARPRPPGSGSWKPSCSDRGFYATRRRMLGAE
jgi:DNA-binding MarR family transcriptional regulator